MLSGRLRHGRDHLANRDPMGGAASAGAHRRAEAEGVLMTGTGNYADSLEIRLKTLRAYLAEAEKDPHGDNLLYIADLRLSIALLSPQNRQKAILQAEAKRRTF
jgi:hypothetical protein